MSAVFAALSSITVSGQTSPTESPTNVSPLPLDMTRSSSQAILGTSIVESGEAEYSSSSTLEAGVGRSATLWEIHHQATATWRVFTTSTSSEVATTGTLGDAATIERVSKNVASTFLMSPVL